MTEKTASISAHLIRNARSITELDDWGPCPEATAQQMDTRGRYLWKGENGSEAGIWECTKGPSRWVLETNEFVHVLSGSMTITPDGGEPELVGPGDTVFIPRGLERQLGAARNPAQALRHLLSQPAVLHWAADVGRQCSFCGCHVRDLRRVSA